MQNSNENEIGNQLIQQLFKENRQNRRWKIFGTVVSLLWLVFFVVIFINLFHDSSSSSALGQKKHVALVRISGMIAPDRNFSAEELVPILKKAFSDKNSVGVVIDINSPGGTPVQAAIIHDAILAYKKKYHQKVVVVGEDLLTSGAYYVAVAADQIYVNANTLTGSIGVIMKGFGFVDAMKKIGVERRVYTAGANKDRLDPFLPLNPDDVAKIDKVMAEVHQNFVQAVKIGRKDKLKLNDEDLFTGDFWSGQSAVRLGLVDHIGNLMDAMQAEFGTTEFESYNENSNIMKMFRDQMTSSFDAVIHSMV